MPYYKELNIYIRERYNVNPTFPISIELCKIAADYCNKKKRVLDIGTGTGIIGIYLSKLGNEVTSTDINKNALNLAEENGRMNNTNLTLIRSNLYENISKKFDVIIFSIPFIVYEHTYSRLFSYLYKKIIPNKIRYYSTRFLYRWRVLKNYAYSTRRETIYKFLEESVNFLDEKGIVIVTVLKPDLPLFKNERRINILEETPSKYHPDESIIVYKYSLHNK